MLWPGRACTMLWIYFDINTSIPSSQHPLAYLAHLLYKPIIPLASRFSDGVFFYIATVFVFFPGRGQSEEDLLRPPLWDFGSERRREYHRAVQKEKEDQENILTQGVCGNLRGELHFSETSSSCAQQKYKNCLSPVPLCGQIRPEDTAEFMNAASQGKVNVIDKYLADGGSPNVHDEVSSPCVAVKQIHLQQTIYTYNISKLSSWRGQHCIAPLWKDTLHLSKCF